MFTCTGMTELAGDVFVCQSLPYKECGCIKGFIKGTEHTLHLFKWIYALPTKTNFTEQGSQSTAKCFTALNRYRTPNVIFRKIFMVLFSEEQ